MNKNKFVKITGCKMSSFWYSDKIGRVFEVATSDMHKNKYIVQDYNYILTGYIDFSDCVILTDAEVLDYKISEIEKKIQVEQDTLEEMLRAKRELTSIKLGDIVSGATFKKDTNTLTLIEDWDGTFLMSGLDGNKFQLFSDTPKTKREMLIYLSNAQKVKD